MRCCCVVSSVFLGIIVTGSVALTVADEPAVARASEDAGSPQAKVLRAGMIGLTTSHVIAFTEVVNDPAATGDLADVEIVAGFTGGIEDNPSSWGRREKYTEDLRKKGVTIYDTIPELLDNVDVVFLEEVDGRPHLEMARLVIEAGKPLFIDKPLAGTLADCIEVFRLAKANNVPCFSSSSLRFGAGFLDAAQRQFPIRPSQELHGLEPDEYRAAPSRSVLVRHPRLRNPVHRHGTGLPDRHSRIAGRSSSASGKTDGSGRSGPTKGTERKWWGARALAMPARTTATNRW